MRIVLFEGDFGYDGVNVFTAGLAEALTARGAVTTVVDLRRPQEMVAQDLSDICDADDVIALIGFNAMGSAIKMDGQPLHEALDVPFVTYMVDHPIFHAEPLTRLATQPVLCVDNAHVRFLEGFGMPLVHYAPHAGATPSGYFAAPGWADRPNRVMFAGSYEPLDELRARLASMVAGDQAATDAGIPPLSEAFEALADEGPFTGDEDLVAAASSHPTTFDIQQFIGISAHFTTLLRCLILWHRARNRHALIKRLDDAGFQVDIHGDGWEAAKFANHRLMGPLPFAELIDVMPTYRFTLASSPLFGDGLNDRMVYGALAGTVVCSERNPETGKLIDAGAILGFTPGEEAALVAAIERLDGTEEGRAMAAKGRGTAAFDHTWAARASKIMSILGR